MNSTSETKNVRHRHPQKDRKVIKSKSLLIYQNSEGWIFYLVSITGFSIFFGLLYHLLYLLWASKKLDMHDSAPTLQPLAQSYQRWPPVRPNRAPKNTVAPRRRHGYVKEDDEEISCGGDGTREGKMASRR